MAAKKSTQTQREATQPTAFLSPEEWENHMIAIAYQSMEERILNGTATGAELVYWAKAGSQKQREEIAKLKEENALLRAKTSAIESEKDRAAFYSEVLAALGGYRTRTKDDPVDPYVL